MLLQTGSGKSFTVFTSTLQYMPVLSARDAAITIGVKRRKPPGLRGLHSTTGHDSHVQNNNLQFAPRAKEKQKKKKNEWNWMQRLTPATHSPSCHRSCGLSRLQQRPVNSFQPALRTFWYASLKSRIAMSTEANLFMHW